MQHTLARAFSLTIALLVAAPVAAENSAAITALCASIDGNIAHAQGWLNSRDFKSLAQTAGGLELLVAVLQSQGDDEPWRETTGHVSQATTALQRAAQSQDMAAAELALRGLSEATDALKKLSPGGKPLPPPKSNLRTLMLLMDGVRGESKIALITGNAEKAKNQAYVLSELGPLVSNLRTGEHWSRLSDEFTAASLTAARSASSDVNELRPLLKAVSQRCDACHESR